MKTTDELAHEIREAGDILSYFEANQREMQTGSFPEYLEQWLAGKGLSLGNTRGRPWLLWPAPPMR